MQQQKMILYFSKINLNSDHIFKVYKDDTILVDVRNKVLAYLQSGIKFEEINSYIEPTGTVIETKIDYEISIENKDADSIEGILYKESTLHYKSRNNGEMISRSVPSAEDIKFYFDVTREMIGFHTRNRFGRKEFNKAIEKLLNKCMEDNNCSYRFTVDIYHEGLELSDIRNSLNKIGAVKQITFKFQPPNPNEEELKKLKQGTTDTVKELEEANATGKSVIFNSEGYLGLNLKSNTIEENLNNIEQIQRGINSNKSLGNGYASVEAVGRNGSIYTTEDRKPAKRKIYDVMDLVDACKDAISKFALPKGEDES